MKLKKERSYNFVVTHTSRSQVYIRRFEVSKTLVKTIAGIAIVSIGCVSYGFYRTSNLMMPEVAANNSAENSQDLQPGTLKTLFPSLPLVEASSAGNATAKTGGPEVPQYPETAENVTNFQIENAQSALQVPETKGLNAENVPSIWPRIGKINNEFGWRRNPFGGRSYENHPGMDISGERGDPVIAPANGTVLKAGWTGGYGNMLEVDHGNGLTTRYGHLSKIEVEIGQEITRGQQIALIGTTGRSTGPHLHYEVRIDNEAINPRPYLPPLPSPEATQ